MYSNDTIAKIYDKNKVNFFYPACLHNRCGKDFFLGENKSTPSIKCPFLSCIFVIHVFKNKIRKEEMGIIHPMDQSANMNIDDFPWREIFVHDVEICIISKFIIMK